MQVFSTTFLGTVNWYKAYLNSSDSIIDLGEHYMKQTHRNRTFILSSNGMVPLIIPIKKVIQRELKHIEISYSENWQNRFLKSIRSAYLNAPYFEHYQEEFETLLMEKPALLHQYNHHFLSWSLKQLDLGSEISYEMDYVNVNPENDYRNLWDHHQEIKPYKQVFSHKFGFTDGLSIVDLLFNKGPESYPYLK